MARSDATRARTRALRLLGAGLFLLAAILTPERASDEAVDGPSNQARLNGGTPERLSQVLGPKPAHAGSDGMPARSTLAARSLVGPAERQDSVLAVPRPPAAPLTSRAGRSASVADVRAAVRAAAAEFGQDAEAMLAVSFCESRWRADALGKAGERGAFQFWPPTWAEEAPLLGYGEEHAWQVEAQARVAAAMWAKGLAGRWTCWRAAHAGGDER